MNLSPVLERLAANIIPYPYASEGRIDGFFSHAHKVDRDRAIQMALLQINGPRCIRYLSFDIDRRFAGIAWDDANLPMPNIILTNPKNGHAHLIYELADPVWLRRKDDPRPETSVVRYLKAVQKAMGASLMADSAYNGLLVKNPFHASWTTTCAHQKPYTLGDLSAHLDLSAATIEAKLYTNPDSRNCTLFDSIRFWAYRVKNHFDNFHTFQNCLFDELDRLNDNLFNPLGLREINSIGKSVAHWVWNKYTGAGKGKRRGIMQLDPKTPIEVRQQQGQAFTSKIRKEKTESVLRATILALKQEGKSISISEVHRRTKLSRTTIYAYWDRFTDLIDLQVSYETGSLRDKSLCSLRSPGASPQQSNTLMGTPLNKSTAYTKEEVVKLVMAMSRTFESSVLPTLDKCNNPRILDEQRVTERFTRRFPASSNRFTDEGDILPRGCFGEGYQSIKH